MQASVVVDEIRNGISLLDCDEVEGFANAAWSMLADNDNGAPAVSAESLATACGGSVVLDADLPQGFDGLIIPTATFVIRPHKFASIQSARVLHELAHWLLRSVAHTHADVWRVTLATALPVRRARLGQPSVLVPSWALRMRWRMLAECDFIPAA